MPSRHFTSLLPRKLLGKKQPVPRSSHNLAARCSTYRFEMDDLNASLCDLPAMPKACPAARVSDDVLVLRVLRDMSSELKRRWREDVGPEEWAGVTMADGRVVELDLRGGWPDRSGAG